MSLRLDGRVGPVDAIGSTSSAALASGSTVLSWHALDQAVESAAVALDEHGVAAGDRVIVGLPLGLAYVVQVLALLRRRMTIIPISDRAPAAFADEVHRLTGARAQIASGGAVRSLAHVAPVERWPDEAAILFTSGSTGRPKGVVVSGSALAARLGWAEDAYFGDPVRRCAARTNPVFIDSLTEILGALRAQRTLVVAPPEAVADLAALATFLRDEAVDQVTIAPSCLPTLHRLLPTGLPDVKRWICSGEPLRAEWARLARALAPAAEIVNSYGSTEVTGDVAHYRIEADVPIPDPVPLGRMVPGTRWEIDGHGTGELLLAGSQLASGYVTSEQHDGGAAFVDGWFRSGDVVRDDGRLLWFIERRGTLDNVRGKRVDLAGVESAAERVAGISEAATAVVDGASGTARLLLFVVADGPDATPGSCRRDLAEVLPAASLPDQVVLVDELPRTASGKRDRAALRPPEAAAPQRSAFESDVEFAVATAVHDTDPHLPLDRLTALADLGTDSLQFVEIADRLSSFLGVEVSPTDLVAWGAIGNIGRRLLASPLPPAIIRTVRSNPGPDLVLLPPAVGSGLCYLRLLPHLTVPGSVALAEETPDALAAIEADGLGRFAGMIADELTGSRQVNLLGWSFGAVLAVFLQHELTARGTTVGRVVAIDPGRARALEHGAGLESDLVRQILADFGYDEEIPAEPTVDDAEAVIRSRTAGSLQHLHPGTFHHWVDMLRLNLASLRAPFPPAPTRPTLVVRGTTPDHLFERPRWASTGAVNPMVEVVGFDGSHFDLMSPPVLRDLGPRIDAFLSGGDRG